MCDKSDKLLILDLDETLIHATEKKLDITEDFKFENFFVYKRPFLDIFLEKVSRLYKIGIWSSGDDDYVEDIVKHIKPNTVNFEFLWGRSKCTPRRDFDSDVYYFEKRLDKLKNKGFEMSKILIVDDSPEKTKNNYGNAIYIQEFTGNKEDIELKYLYEYLQSIKDNENFRLLGKRGWRNKFIDLQS